MYLNTLKLQNFRNYNSININLNKNINIFYGNNAQGKTNLLESIYFLGIADSHRNVEISKLITNECENSILNTNANISNINYQFQIELFNNKKKLYIDNKKINKVSDYVSKIKVIIFSPEDLFLIKGIPENRRKYFDTQIIQLNSNYYNVLNSYNNLLKIRNKLLKNKMNGENIDIQYFNILTSCLIDRSIIIYRNRKKYIEKINKIINNTYYELSNISDFSIKYINNTDIDLSLDNNKLKQELINKYNNNFEIEISAGKTILGPQFDDYEFYLNDKNIKEYGSQGQNRIAILSLKLSEINVFKNYTGENPILLLDDVFSELDQNKKNNLLSYINNDLQVIITTTDLNDLNITDNAKIFKIKNGQVEEE